SDKNFGCKKENYVDALAPGSGAPTMGKAMLDKPKAAFAPALIGGEWLFDAERCGQATNPATGEAIGHHAIVTDSEIHGSVEHAVRGFRQWRRTDAAERSRLLLLAASLLMERQREIAETLSREQGKPLGEAMGEVVRTAELTQWYGQEARRLYGR